jgi:hypothetical protein
MYLSDVSNRESGVGHLGGSSQRDGLRTKEGRRRRAPVTRQQPRACPAGPDRACTPVTPVRFPRFDAKGRPLSTWVGSSEESVGGEQPPARSGSACGRTRRAERRSCGRRRRTAAVAGRRMPPGAQSRWTAVPDTRPRSSSCSRGSGGPAPAQQPAGRHRRLRRGRHLLRRQRSAPPVAESTASASSSRCTPTSRAVRSAVVGTTGQDISYPPGRGPELPLCRPADARPGRDD